MLDLLIKSLRHNIIKYRNKEYLVAGLVQFKTIWIRDACFCSDTLVEIGLEHIVRNTIDIYLRYLIKDENGLYYGPKGLDTMNLEWRTVKMSIRHLFNFDRDLSYSGHRYYEPFDKDTELIALYKDSRNSIAIDSNVLIVLSIFSLRHGSDYYIYIEKLLKWYSQFKNKHGLIVKGPYSDWKDSQRREGIVFSINLLYYVALQKFDNKIDSVSKVFKINLPILKETIINTFFDRESNLFRASVSKKYISLDDNLFSIKYDFYRNKQVYRALKNSKLWSQSELKIPGFANELNCISYDEIHWQVKTGFLEEYHVSLYWGWLIAFSGIIAFKMSDPDESLRIYNIIKNLLKRDKHLGEVYSPVEGLPLFESMTYKSEIPFSMALCYAISLSKLVEGSL